MMDTVDRKIYSSAAEVHSAKTDMSSKYAYIYIYTYVYLQYWKIYTGMGGAETSERLYQLTNASSCLNSKMLAAAEPSQKKLVASKLFPRHRDIKQDWSYLSLVISLAFLCVSSCTPINSKNENLQKGCTNPEST